MTRKQKTTPVEDLFNVISLLPWWVGVILAIVSFFVLRAFAIADPPKVTDANQAIASLPSAVWKAFATAGMYLVPPICLLGAAASAWQRRKRKSLVSYVAESQAADSLNGMTWREFEMTVAEAFRLDGFRVEDRGGSSADGGIDLVLYREREKFLVQCKQWKAYTVGVGVVRELYGVMASEGATGGFVVTSGKFSKDAVDFAEGRNVTLVDGPILFDMIKHAEAARTVRPADVMPMRTQPLTPTDAVICPSCGSQMVRRIAKRGPNAGNEFWGCLKYPDCSATRSIY